MGTAPALTIRIDARNGVTRIALLGELDMATVAILNDQLAVVQQDHAEVILVDLRDLSFIDCSGLRALVRAYDRSETNRHRLLLVGAKPLTRRLCEITGTEFLLDAQETAQLLGRFAGDGSRPGERDGEVGAEAHV